MLVVVLVFKPRWSLNHALHHLRLDGAISEVFAVEILRLVRHSVASVAHDRDLHTRPVRQVLGGHVVVRVHCDLVASRHFRVVVALTSILNVQTWAQRIHVEEGVLSVLDIGHWSPVERLVAGVTNSGEVHPRAFFFDFNSLEPMKNGDLNHSSKRSKELTQHRGIQRRQPDP